MRFLSRFFVVFSATLLIVLGSGCASASKKKTPPPPNPVANKLPKPAPMRVAADTSNRRNAPALPKIVDLTPKKETDTAATDLVPPPEKTTVASTVPKFIDNEQPQDFFQGAGDVPVGETVLGSFFDSVFRPANPPNQPVSSTTYTVE
jgi:hypothetical protein